MKLSKLLRYLDSLKILDLVIRFKRWNNTLLVVMYHEIEKNVYYDRGIPTKLFEEEIKYLSKLGFIFLPLCKAVETIFEEPNKLHRIAVLTFDDAYKGVYEYALPIMSKYGVKGTIYPVAGFVENHVAHWATQIGFILRRLKVPSKIRVEELNLMFSIEHDHQREFTLREILNLLPKLDVNEISILIQKLIEALNEQDLREFQELYELTLMNKKQLRELAELGFEIGGHGFWHVGLTYISKDRLYQEIMGSLDFVKTFTKNSICKIRSFAYPYGLYNNDVIDTLKKIGFHIATTMETSVNRIDDLKLYEVSRVSPYRFGITTLTTFKAQLIGVNL
jgi:peptidoglycan/xylan/chitin deacetylase (PgdA/CDA1 family)